MIIKILIKYIVGYIRISVEGYYIERFINICKTNQILIWNLKKDKNVRLYLNLGIKDFKKVVQIARRTKCKVKIKGKRGLPFILHKYKKRKIFAIFLVLIMLCIMVSSKYIWNIEIQVEENQELANIMEDVNKAGLVVGVNKKQINTKEVVTKIRLERDDISWIGIELKGTNAIVRIVKSDKAPELLNPDEYCNIVSNQNAEITKIVARNGTAAVKVGDIVQKGTVLISGTMEGKYTGTRYVHSVGEIEAKVWYTGSKFIPYIQEEKKKTGNREEKYQIKIKKFKINLYKTLSKFKIYDTIEDEKKFKIFSNLYLPISIIKQTNNEQTIEKVNYSKDEAIQKGIKELENELEEKIKNKENILQKNVNKYEREDGIEVHLTYEVLENIGTEEKIQI